MNYNHCTILGRLGADPETKTAASGSAVTRIRVGSSVGFGDKKQTLWMSCTAFGKTAEFVARLHKGDGVLVAGRLEPNVWTDKAGNERRDVVLLCDSVQVVGGKPAQSGGISKDVPF
jgi:single-strand DNA-binding protein